MLTKMSKPTTFVDMVGLLSYRIRWQSAIRSAVVGSLLFLLCYAWAYPYSSNDRTTAGSVGPSKITLSLLNCGLSTTAEQPSIKVSDLSTGYGPVWSVTATSARVEQYLSTISFSLSAGTYQLIITQGKCGALFDITVLAGLDREITVALQRPAFIDYHVHNSLAGRLPFNGFGAELLYCYSANCDVATGTGFQTRPVEVDGAAYYVNALGSGIWYLRLYLATSRTFIVVPIEGTDRTGMHFGHFERDFAASEIESLWQQQMFCTTPCPPK